jgi:hypothetical protein
VITAAAERVRGVRRHREFAYRVHRGQAVPVDASAVELGSLGDISWHIGAGQRH